MTIHHKIANARHWLPEWRQVLGGASLAIMLAGSAAAADLQTPAAPQYAEPVAYNWTGFYVGSNTGFAWGKSNYTSSAGDKSFFNIDQSYDGFNQGGSWFNGVDIGYNRMLPSRVVVGAEADFNFSAYTNYYGNNIGNTATLKNNYNYTDNIYISGTALGKIGYAPGNYLFYAMGGFAWTSENFIEQSATGLAATFGYKDQTYQQRVGYAVGGGVEGLVIPHWTVKAEYLYSDFGTAHINFPVFGERVASSLSEQQFRVGVNYHFGDDNALSVKDGLSLKDAPVFDPDKFNFHAQATFTEQGYPKFQQGPNGGVPGPAPVSYPTPGGLIAPAFLGFPNGGWGREIGEVTLFAGVRPWKGAEIWIDPEIDQGIGLNGTIGVSAYVNGEAFKIGSSEPYAKIQRLIFRQTIDLGGETVELPADLNQFATTTTSDRLVFSAGRLTPLDYFQRNTYTGNPKTQFVNWGFLYPLTFDWGGDAWGFGWGAVLEYYKGPYAARLAWFDTEKNAISDAYPNLIYGDDPTFKQYDIIADLEENHKLWGQPGKVEVVANLIGGLLGTYKDAFAALNQPGSAAYACEMSFLNSASPSGFTPQTSCVRKFTNKIDFSVNMEQAITSDIGVFSRLGWHPGYIEALAISDSNFSASGGVSVKGTSWGLPEDTIGVAALYNQISKAEQYYLSQGGIGSFVGDGYNQAFNPQAEEVFEAYYNHQLTASVNVTLDYQLLANPGENGDRGPINLFAVRAHWQF